MARRAARALPRPYRSPLAVTLHHPAIPKDHLASLESIYRAPTSPSWKSHFQVHIAPSEEEAKAHCRELRVSELTPVFYSDGSSIGNLVGAAAFQIGGGGSHAHLGTSSSHTVFDAELLGVRLSLEMFDMANKFAQDVHVLLDNQAAIIALANFLTQSLPSTSSSASTNWPPGSAGSGQELHSISIGSPVILVSSGIIGNHSADAMAKSAAQNPEHRDVELTPLPISISAVMQNIATNLAPAAIGSGGAAHIAHRRYTTSKAVFRSLADLSIFGTSVFKPKTSVASRLREVDIPANRLHEYFLPKAFPALADFVVNTARFLRQRAP
ncbi:hypothetical protein OC846_006037 [Tilletia horrida]|uniref:RNase H type-1 domain-containing protein n=1 Tax=Tilletia horrida TaxID=155126 RepID=A0AAN6JVE9_9BASI|nr:hypothetical protein OC846_006037 [Tilletia horrida]KAK0560595.1 hypothetical protein OC861_006214 [Tilletia horrida]